MPRSAARLNAFGASSSGMVSEIMSLTCSLPLESIRSAGSNRPHREPISVISFTITGAVSIAT